MTRRLNDQERGQWVENDEPLYQLRRRSRLSLRAFVRENRQWLDEYINSRINRRPGGLA